MVRRQWKFISGYEFYYEVSNDGLVRSVSRAVKDHNSSRNKLIQSRILRPGIRAGYLGVHLWKNGKGQNAYIHRLVAETFVPNPENKPQVNHKDGDRMNNYFKNLEWTTSSENHKHAHHVLKRKRSGCCSPSKSILCTTTKQTFASQSEAARALGLHVSNISKVVKGHYKHTGGFHFVETGG